MALTPREAILEELSQPWRVVTSRRDDSGWESSSDTGWPDRADLSTVRFLKLRSDGPRQLHAIAYEDESGKQCGYLIGVIEEGDRDWRVCGMAGGGGDSPERDEPWVNMAAWWSHDELWAGGWVTGAGHDEARAVRLRFNDDTVVEDRVDGEDLVLFLSTGSLALPATVEILDGHGHLLASHPSGLGEVGPWICKPGAADAART